MADAYLMYARWYVRYWDVAVAFQSATSQRPVPLHKWENIAAEGINLDDVDVLYAEARKRSKSQHLRLSIVTGEYQYNRDRHHIVIDLDLEGFSRDDIQSLAKKMARDGFTVVITPRGLHIHAYVPRSERVYQVAVLQETDEGVRQIGEGSALQRHLWTSPPSTRKLTDTWFKYQFMLPNGQTFGDFDPLKLKEVQPTDTTLNDLSHELELLFSAYLKTYRPDESIPQTRKITGDVPLPRKPLFINIDDFLAKVTNVPLPIPVAWVLYLYADATGLESLASDILARNPMIPERKVPRGTRFLVASEFTLFLAHTVTLVKYSDVIEMLEPAIEAWPADAGMPLDRQLKYLLLFSDDGYIYPRYGGLGALRPGGAVCKDCFYLGACDNQGAVPWRHYRRISRRLGISWEISSAV